jgi:hypothetical protein
MVATTADLPTQGTAVSDALVALISKANPGRPAKRRQIGPEAGTLLRFWGTRSNTLQMNMCIEAPVFLRMIRRSRQFSC